MLRVSRHYPSTLVIDGEPCKFRIAKLKDDEYTAFAQEFQRLGKLSIGEKLDLKPRPGEEDLSADEIEAKRYFELTPEQRAERDAREKEEAARGNTFAADSIRRYVTAEPGQIYDEDEARELTSGEDLLAHFGSRPDVLRDLVAEIFLQNRLSEADKKKLRLLRASLRSSSAPAAAGNGPDATVANAASSDSAISAPATASPESDPSGSMGL